MCTFVCVYLSLRLRLRQVFLTSQRASRLPSPYLWKVLRQPFCIRRLLLRPDRPLLPCLCFLTMHLSLVVSHYVKRPWHLIYPMWRHMIVFKMRRQSHSTKQQTVFRVDVVHKLYQDFHKFKHASSNGYSKRR